jgi:serine/threonine protein kinase/Tol biopolymer transport system component
MSGKVQRHHRVRAIYESVRELPAAARGAADAEACADDSGLRREVIELLDAEAQLGSFLERGAAGALSLAADLCGRRIGPYEVRTMLGAGGMGEVYHAHDTRLRRDVALKILPDLFRQDPDRLARFRREAEILASLNHGSIAAVYGFEEGDGVCALVMELVPGPTLADRIAKGPIPVDESLEIARQLVDALDAAHERGIVHRDLKPTNIKVRDDGTVKVLDFGLAKVIPRDGVASTGSAASQNGEATGLGVVLGTAAYMSPEQAQGLAIDTRTDIWAFGCVLSEMLSGERSGGRWAERRSAATPPPLLRLLSRCLERDRKRRLADIADARADLDQAAEWLRDPSTRRGGMGASKFARWAPWATAMVAIVIAAWFALTPNMRRSTPDTAVLRTSVLVPSRLGDLGTSVSLSPDGRQLALVAQGTDGRPHLFIRDLAGWQPRQVDGTAGTRTPFWSPDSQWVAFVQDGQLRKVSSAGGEPVTLCDGAWLGGTWNDNQILFTTTSRAVAVVSGSGGTPRILTHMDPRAEESGHLSPTFLPDGRHYLYVRHSTADEPQVYLRSLDSDAETAMAVAATTVQFANGLLWFVRGSTLMAQPVDLEQRALAGSPIAVAEQVRIDATFVRAAFFSVSPAGLLTFQADPRPGAELVWYDRGGQALASLGAAADYADTVVSPDGTRVLVSIRRGSAARDFWIFDNARGVASRVTFDEAPIRRGAIWSRDGSHIIYSTGRDGRVRVVQRRADGAGTEAVLLEDEFDKEVASETPDGKFLLYNVRRGGEPPAAWVLPLTGDRRPFPFSQPRAFFPQSSPDGRWVAYMSGESGRNEIYVVPFTGSGAKTRISTNGGIDPVWRADGREIIYLANNQVMSASVTARGHDIHVGEVKALFQHTKIGPRKAHDIAPDGQRILAVTRRAETASSPLTLIINWPALVKQ